MGKCQVAPTLVVVGAATAVAVPELNFLPSLHCGGLRRSDGCVSWRRGHSSDVVYEVVYEVEEKSAKSLLDNDTARVDDRLEK